MIVNVILLTTCLFEYGFSLNSRYTYYRSARGAFSVKNASPQERPLDQLNVDPSKNKNVTNEKRTLIALPRFALSKATHIKFDPKQYLCKQEEDPICINKTLIFKERVLSEFIRVRDELIPDPNIYHINYKRRSNNIKPNKTLALCLMMNAKVQMLRKTNKLPFSSNLLGSLFPKEKFLAQYRGPNKTCVIVSSAGSMKTSKLGTFIGK